MRIGYSFWGYLGDVKFDYNTKIVASTPDGNAFYSWAIINELLKQGHTVYQMMPDRDSTGSDVLGDDLLFMAWASDKRKSVYENTKKTLCIDSVKQLDESKVHSIWEDCFASGCELILHEWRMEIPGRNTEDARNESCWQPDLFIQECLIDFCIIHRIKMVIFDLDYKLSLDKIESLKERGLDFTVFELGNKWNGKDWAKKVYIPFDFDSIYEFKPKSWVKDKLVYVGNRYERDWCIDKYIPKNMGDVTVYGNWNEGGRDSATRWPNINFGHRLQTAEMQKVYSNSASTILLAKHDYCEFGFMTARIIEALFYGTVPLFIEEYGDELIREFAGSMAKTLTVHSVEDVVYKCNELFTNYVMRVTIINNLRERLKKFMDVKYFVDELLSC